MIRCRILKKAAISSRSITLVHVGNTSEIGADCGGLHFLVLNGRRSAFKPLLSISIFGECADVLVSYYDRGADFTNVS